MKHRTMVGGSVLLFVVGISAGLGGQAQRRDATLDDLLMEVRALRADLKQAAVASVKAQAVMARSALQEQRLRTVSENLNRAQVQLAAATEQRREAEERMAAITSAPVVGNPMGRDDMLAELKRDVARLQSAEEALRARVGEWSGVVFQEQARWEDVNRRVEALEKQQ